MHYYAIICLDNNPSSIQYYQQELRLFSECFEIYCADNIEKAKDVITSVNDSGQTVALVISCHHQHLNGAQLLIDLDTSTTTKSSKKILILNNEQDLPTLMTTVNESQLDHCLAKPLETNQLHMIVRKLLTKFIIEEDNSNLLSFSSCLDQQQLVHACLTQSMNHFHQGFINDYYHLSDLEIAERLILALYDRFHKSDETHACRTYSANHLLTKEGQENRYLWFLTNGEVALYKTDDQGTEREVVRHKKGNLVGGMSFVTGEPSFSTAITLTKAHVIKIDRDLFGQLMQSNNELLPLFTHLLLRHFNRRLQRSIVTKIELQKTLESLESTQNQLIEQEKMAVLGQLIAGVAHELNNPISAILRGVDTLTHRLDTILNHIQSSFDTDLAKHIFQQNLRSQPLSTAEERQKVSDLEQRLGDRLLAKKLVKLHQENNNDLLQKAKQSPAELKARLEMLDNYAMSGSALRSISVCSQRIADMVKSLKSYARGNHENYAIVDLHEGIEDTLVIFENRLKRHQITKSYGEIPLLYCQPNALQQVWTNLISNAADALPEQDGQLMISTEKLVIDSRNYIKVTFSDNGIGIPQPLLDKIFELNFTTKKEGNFGLGIGLSVCQKIIQDHKGDIKIASNPGEGTTVSVYLLISDSQQPVE